MAVKICAVNSKFIHSNPAVHSLACYCRSLCDINKIKIEVCEFTVNDVYKNVLHSIMSGRPEVIAFSVYIWNVSFISKLCGDIKKIDPSIKIILGGPEVSFDVPALFCEQDYDYIIAGEGERAFACLISEIYGLDVAGCSDHLAEIPFIYSQDNINLFKDRIIYYESSRGCPFSCAYCLSARSGQVRSLSVGRVCEDINFFIQAESVKQVKFVDRTFNYDKDRAYAIFEYIINNNRGGQNFHFEICADLLDERAINLLKNAAVGLIQFEIGIQTTNEKALDICGRKTDINKCFENIKLLLKNKNINIHVDLIAGLPEDSLEDFKHTFNQAYDLKADQLQLGFLKLLRGAPLNNLVEKYGYKFSSQPPYEILENACLSHEDLAVLHGVSIALDRYYNSGRFAESLDYYCGLFNTPFDFYARLSAYMLRHGWLYHPCSPENLNNILLEFIN